MEKLFQKPLSTTTLMFSLIIKNNIYIYIIVVIVVNVVIVVIVVNVVISPILSLKKVRPPTTGVTTITTHYHTS